jgi:hypothetical protein
MRVRIELGIFLSYIFNGGFIGWDIYNIVHGGGALYYILAGTTSMVVLWLDRMTKP